MKQLIIQRITACIALCSLASCIASPHIVESMQGADFKRSCAELTQQVSEAERYKREARAEDGFRFSYIFIIPAAWSVYNMHLAEVAAETRLNSLEEIYEQRNCEKEMGQKAQQPYQQGQPLNPAYGQYRQNMQPGAGYQPTQQQIAPPSGQQYRTPSGAGAPSYRQPPPNYAPQYPPVGAYAGDKLYGK